MTTTPDLSGFICRVHLESRWLSLEATVDIGTLPEGKLLAPASDVDFLAGLLNSVAAYARRRAHPLAVSLRPEPEPDVDAMGHSPGEVFEPDVDGEPLLDPERLDFADELTIVRDAQTERAVTVADVIAQDLEVEWVAQADHDDGLPTWLESDDAGGDDPLADEPEEVRSADEVFDDLRKMAQPIVLTPEQVEPHALAVEDLYSDGKIKVFERPAKLAELLGIPRARVAPFTRMARSRGWWRG